MAKKDFNAPKHDELDVPNLQVIKACQSLTSREFVKTQFSWQYYYYTLTDAGIEYVREWYAWSRFCTNTFRLHLPAEIVPLTHRKAPRAQQASSGFRRGGGR